jgi:hypothetical protein
MFVALHPMTAINTKERLPEIGQEAFALVEVFLEDAPRNAIAVRKTEVRFYIVGANFFCTVDVDKIIEWYE